MERESGVGKRRLGFIVTVVAGLLLVVPAMGQQRNFPACEEAPRFHRLDFWVGDWDVFTGEKKAGTNRIEKILKGCAIIENWTGTGGSEGKSLFYYNSAMGKWKQVWITQQATRPGGMKEKTLIKEFEDGGVRFQGEITLPNGRTYLDRTTLTPLEEGKVRQVIETSRDGGKTWRVGFDAVYVPVKR